MDYEMMCAQLITYAGNAKSLYIEAVQEAKKGDYESAAAKMKEGEKSFLEGHKIHAEFLTKEANGELPAMTLLLVHTEDQLMGAESFKTMAEEMIEVYQKLGKENK